MLAALLVMGFASISLRKDEKSVLHGSGVPASIAQMLLSSVHISSQHLLGVLIMVILSFLIGQRAISTEAGLPLVSAVVGYLVGTNFKDVSFISGKKGKETS
jgi:hypothetical protein